MEKTSVGTMKVIEPERRVEVDDNGAVVPLKSDTGTPSLPLFNILK